MGNNVAISQGDLDDWTHPSNTWQFMMRQLIARISTMKLVQVKAVNGGGAGAVAVAGTVDVLPLVNQIDGNGNMTAHGTVSGLPWWRLQGGTGAVICDPKVGDIGMVLCADRDSSGVIRSKAQANPGSRRKYDLADGIYVGSILGLTPTQYLDFVDAGGLNLIDSLGNTLQFETGGIFLTPATGQSINLNGPTNVENGPLHVIAHDATVDGNLNVGGAAAVTGALTALSAQINGTTKITRISVGTCGIPVNNFSSLSSLTFTGTMTGAQPGDYLAINWPGGPAHPLLVPYVRVITNDVLTVTLSNPTLGTLTGGGVNVFAMAFGTT